jgi:HD-GYP domain-containing protein (c-di-GMP phosphodiesterase class II)
MEQIPLSTLTNGLTFTADLFIDNSFLILPQTVPISDSLIQTLTTWEFDTLLSEGNLSLGGDIEIPQDFEKNTLEKEDEYVNPIKKVMENSAPGIVLNGEDARMKMVQDVYNEYLNYIERLFTRYATHKTINQEELFETVKDLCVFIKENRRFILRINPSPQNCKHNFLVNHSMRSAVLAIAIAQYMKIPLSKMIELGVTAILHEIGMLRLPPQIYMTSKQLSPSEKNQIKRHPVLGYTILKDLSFPLVVQLGVLEHHETESGEGYPRRLSGEKISTNAKIISVCCTFEATTAQREYKDEKSSFEAMFELLLNQKNWYSDSVIRALLCTVSLYPIGSYVFLKSGKIALVVDVNPSNPRNPIVQLLTEKDADGSLKTVQTDNETFGIARILTTQEKEDVLKAIQNEQEKQKNQQATNNISKKEEKKITESSEKTEITSEENVDLSFFD